MHGEDLLSIASVSLDTVMLSEAEKTEMENRDFLIFTEEELEEMIKKKMEESKVEIKQQ